MNDSEEYYCFRVKERIDSKLGDIVIIPRWYDIDLKKLRTDLWKQFGVPKDRRISYIDDDGDDVPIDSECEFLEALKLAKSAFVVNSAIPLIVGSFHMSTSCSDNEQCSATYEICCPSKEQSRSINANPYSSFTDRSNGSMLEPNPELDKQKCPIRKISSNEKKLDLKRCNESSEERTELEDMEVPRELKPSLRCYSDTVPPPWFTEYMETMKKDMVAIITQEVVKNVTEVLNKRLDSLTFPSLKELGQSRSQSHSSLPKRHLRCSFDSNEKSQKRMRSQDEEQSSDASIERVDEPQNINAAEDQQTKKDVISTINQEVLTEITWMLTEITGMLNRILLDPVSSALSKKLDQSRSQSHLPSSKRLPRHFDSHSKDKSQRKMRSQDGEQSSDDASMEHMYEPRKANTAYVSRQLQNYLLLGDATSASMKEEKRKKKYHQRVAQVATDNPNNDIGKGQEQSTQSNAREDFVSRKNLPLLVDPIPHDEALGMFENELLRMSCSVTGHQILDENRRSTDVWCDNSDIDKTSFWSCDVEEVEDDDDAFEIIEMPASGSRYELLTHPGELAAEQRRHDSNRDSPSFELLSDSPSPTCFMYFNEEHFSANEGHAEQLFADTNPSTSSIYVIDIHGKVYSEHQLTDTNERIGADLEKRSGGAYSFVTETLPVQNARCSKSCPEQRLSDEKKGPRGDVTCDNANSSYDDVRNSHTSYLTVRTHCDSKSQSQCSCQSQTDLNDFTQSFHSHTTSVNDTTDIYTEAYGSGRYGEQTIAKDIREAAAMTTATATATATATTAPRHDHNVRLGGGCTKEVRANESHCHQDNYSERFCASRNSARQGIPVDTPYQSGRANGSSDRSSSNIGSRKTSIGEQTLGSADPVHILPETLVTAAAHVGSFAYDTAREMFGKIRAHTREDSVRQQGGIKSADKKQRFFVGPLSLY